MHPAKPRIPFSRSAQLRLAYELHGWKVTVFAALLFGSAFLVFAAVRYQGIAAVPLIAGAQTNDAGIFQTEMLYAAAHAYAAEHSGALPPAESWKTELRPYLVRAGAQNVLAPHGKYRFVMNSALSDTPLERIASPAQTLLFWEAETNQTCLPPSEAALATVPFRAVTTSGRSVVAQSDGNKGLFLRRAEYTPPFTGK